MAELTDKRRRFVEEYLVDLNATQAAIRAGYSASTAHVQGPRLLENVRVREAIDVALAKRSQRTEITADEVIQGYARILRSDIRKVIRWGHLGTFIDPNTGEAKERNGVELIGSAEIDDDTAVGISEISQSRDGSLRVKFHDKRGALDALAKHHGIFDRPVRLDLPAVATAEDVAGALQTTIAAMAAGEITPTQASAVAGVLETKRRSIETVDLEQRIARLEEGLGSDGNG